MKNRVRELRTAREWSQGELAEKLKVSRQTINAIETEKYDPSLPLALKLARLFKRPVEELFEDGERGAYVLEVKRDPSQVSDVTHGPQELVL